MWFRAYFLASKLAILGGLLLAVVVVVRGLGDDRVLAVCPVAAAVCFFPYAVLSVVLWLWKPASTCPLCGARVAWNESFLWHRLDCPKCGRVSGRPGRDWRLHAEPAGPVQNAGVPDGWRPNAVSVFISADLVPEMQFRKEEVLRRVGAVRAKHGIDTRVRIRDDQLLAARSYEIAINGVYVAGYTLATRENLESHLPAALDAVYDRYADVVRYFGAQEAAVS